MSSTEADVGVPSGQEKAEEVTPPNAEGEQMIADQTTDSSNKMEATGEAQGTANENKETSESKSSEEQASVAVDPVEAVVESSGDDGPKETPPSEEVVNETSEVSDDVDRNQAAEKVDGEEKIATDSENPTGEVEGGTSSVQETSDGGMADEGNEQPSQVTDGTSTPDVTVEAEASMQAPDTKQNETSDAKEQPAAEGTDQLRVEKPTEEQSQQSSETEPSSQDSVEKEGEQPPTDAGKETEDDVGVATEADATKSEEQPEENAKEQALADAESTEKAVETNEETVESTEKAVETNKEAEESTEKAGETNKEAEESTEKAGETNKEAEESTEKAGETNEEIAESTEKAVETNEETAESTEEAGEINEETAESTEEAGEINEETVEITKKAGETNQETVESTEKTAEISTEEGNDAEITDKADVSEQVAETENKEQSTTIEEPSTVTALTEDVPAQTESQAMEQVSASNETPEETEETKSETDNHDVKEEVKEENKVKAPPKVLPKPKVEIPEIKVQLFVKAHARFPTKLGDCPFSHRVMMILKAKKIGGSVCPVNLNIKSAEFEDFCAKNGLPMKVPILKHGDNVIGDSNLIADYMDKLKPEPSLVCTDKKVIAAGDKIFLKFSAFVKNKLKSNDDKLRQALVDELEKLDNFLGSSSGKCLAGDEFKHPDCLLLPKLHHVRVASKHYKKFEIPEKLGNLHAYLAFADDNPIFSATAPPHDAVIEGWRKHVS